MSRHLFDLASRLKPLRSVQARIVLLCLAELADDDGDCGEVPLRRLAEMTQCPNSSLTSLLDYLEDDLGLISKVERRGAGPSGFRVHEEALRNPDAHHATASRTVKAIGGPLDQLRLSPPDIPDEGRHRITSRRSRFASRPLTYVPGRDRLGGPGLVPVLLEYRDQAGTRHVYRFGTKAWLYSGISVRDLLPLGASTAAPSKLEAVDILTVEELDDAVRRWRDAGVSDEPCSFAGHLAAFGSHLRAPGAERPLLTDIAVVGILAVHDRWQKARSTAEGRAEPPVAS